MDKNKLINKVSKLKEDLAYINVSNKNENFMDLLENMIKYILNGDSDNINMTKIDASDIIQSYRDHLNETPTIGIDIKPNHISDTYKPIYLSAICDLNLKINELIELLQSRHATMQYVYKGSSEIDYKCNSKIREIIYLIDVKILFKSINYDEIFSPMKYINSDSNITIDEMCYKMMEYSERLSVISSRFIVGYSTEDINNITSEIKTTILSLYKLLS